MGKKEEEEIIRIAKKMDKMAQKKNGVRCFVMNESPVSDEATLIHSKLTATFMKKHRFQSTQRL